MSPSDGRLQKEEITTILRWDLDILAASTDDGWYLLEGADPGSQEALANEEPDSHGTVVLWDVLDRIVTPATVRKISSI